MKRLDSLVLRELLGPWLFGVGIFTVLILAGTYLFKLTGFIVKGISIGTIIQYTLVLLPGVVTKTMPMAMLLSTLLAFGRLSGDSEVVAMRAVGTSIQRIMWPVGAFGLLVSLVTFFVNETLVPWAALQGTKIEADISSKLDGRSVRPTSYPIYEGKKLKAMLMAADFDIGQRALREVTIATYDDTGHQQYVMTAAKLTFELKKGKFDPDKGWMLSGGGTIHSLDGMTYTRLSDKLWPQEIPHPNFSDEELIASNLKDLDSFNMGDTHKQIEKLKEKNAQANQIANLEYGYWNKIAIPFAALVYALVGAPLGIRNHRTGAAVGFWLSVIIIFTYMMLANFMAIYAQGGIIPAYVASFFPTFIGLAAAVYLIIKKN